MPLIGMVLYFFSLSYKNINNTLGASQKSGAAPKVPFAEPLPSHIWDFMQWGVGSLLVVFYVGWD